MREGWTYMKLGVVATIAAGQSAPQGNDNYCQDGTPFVKAGNLEGLINGVQESEIQKVSDEVAHKHRLKRYPAGSVLFAKSGMSCMKGLVYTLKNDCYVVSHLAIVTPKQINSSFLNYFFQIHKPNNLVKDASYPSISLKDIENLPVLIPPLAEQERIVAELDLLSSVIKKKKAQLEEYDKLAQSFFYDMFGDPVTNEKGWEYKKLGVVATIAAGQSAPQGNDNYCQDGTPFVKAGNLEGLINGVQESEIQKVSDEVAHKHRLKRYPAGSVLFAKSGMSCMKGLVYTLKNDCYVVSHLAIVTPKQINSSFLNYFFQIHKPNNLVKDASYPSISLKDIENLSVLVPPLFLQQSFAAKIEAIEKQKKLIKQSIAETETLFDSRMDFYFN